MAVITASKAIEKAKSYVGTKESPMNSNNVIFNTHYYGRPVNGSAYPWCCAFMWDIFRMLGASELFCGGSKTAYCPTVETYAKNHKQWYTTGKAGDLGLMNFGDGGRSRHIGIVVSKNSDGTYTTVEGNTSTSSNDNGGCVMIRTRRAKDFRGFFRPAYANSTTTSKPVTETKKPVTTNKPVKVASAKKKSNALIGKYKVSVNPGSTLAMRTDAGTNFDKIMSLKRGDVVTCYGYYNVASNNIKWLYVIAPDGKTAGYVCSKYLVK